MLPKKYKNRKFTRGTSVYAIFVDKYFQILPISHNFYHEYWKFSKIDKKITIEKLKTQEKT